MCFLLAGDTIDVTVPVLHANAFPNNKVTPVLVTGPHFTASATRVGRWIPATSAGMTRLIVVVVRVVSQMLDQADNPDRQLYRPLALRQAAKSVFDCSFVAG